MFPISKTDVRLIVGTETFENNLEHINKNSMLLQVNPDSSVTIKPYKDLIITQIDGNERYPNKFKVEDIYGRKFNVFFISYEYKIGNTTKIMQEELRLEVKPE